MIYLLSSAVLTAPRSMMGRQLGFRSVLALGEVVEETLFELVDESFLRVVEGRVVEGNAYRVVCPSSEFD